MMFIKGALWDAFVTDTLDNGSQQNVRERQACSPKRIAHRPKLSALKTLDTSISNRFSCCRMMFTKGALWGAFVTDTLDNASPCDLYYARHDSQREFKEGPLQKLANLSKGMQYKMLNIVYLMEDLKVRTSTDLSLGLTSDCTFLLDLVILKAK